MKKRLAALSCIASLLIFVPSGEVNGVAVAKISREDYSSEVDQDLYSEFYGEEIYYEEEEEEYYEEPSYGWDGTVLTAYSGVNYGPTGKETYYNLPMDNIVSMMRSFGYSAEDYPYWVRDDGCKMLGPYIMVAANLDHFPRGSIVECSLGTALVCDTGGFAQWEEGWSQLDIATNW